MTSDDGLQSPCTGRLKIKKTYNSSLNKSVAWPQQTSTTYVLCTTFWLFWACIFSYEHFLEVNSCFNIIIFVLAIVIICLFIFHYAVMSLSLVPVYLNPLNALLRKLVFSRMRLSSMAGPKPKSNWKRLIDCRLTLMANMWLLLGIFSLFLCLHQVLYFM